MYSLKEQINFRTSKVQDNIKSLSQEVTAKTIEEIRPLLEKAEKAINLSTLEITNNLEDVSKETSTLKSMVTKINSSFEKFSKKTDFIDVKENLSSINDELSEYKEQLKSIISEKISQLDASLDYRNIDELVSPIREIIETLSVQINSTQDSLYLLGSWVDGAGSVIESISTDIQDCKKIQKSYDKKFNQLTSEIEKINANQEKIQKSLEKIERALRI